MTLSYPWIELQDLAVRLVLEDQARGVVSDHFIVQTAVRRGHLGPPVVEALKQHGCHVRCNKCRPFSLECNSV